MARIGSISNVIHMTPDLVSLVKTFIEQEQLPDSYLETVQQWFEPMVEELLVRISAHEGTYVIGISGCQGSGKSTLAALLVNMLNGMLGLRCINLSIDDFYLTHLERQDLAREVHTLLATRGVPGTHDVPLAMNTIRKLSESGQVAVPRFNKAIDDRYPEQDWPRLSGPVDVIVLEGWCLSIGPQNEAELEEGINALEQNEDADGAWRRYVNAAIGNDYLDFYALVDYLVMLKAPDFDKVYEWRHNQEDKLAAAQSDTAGANNRIMSPEELQRFIQHYERVTRHGLQTLPEKADVVFQLTERQTIETRL
jgi:D-glycerate 3-kinase